MAKMLRKAMEGIEEYQEWWEEKSTQEKVKREIQLVLDHLLPKESYDMNVFSQKVDVTFQHFFELAQAGKGVAA